MARAVPVTLGPTDLLVTALANHSHSLQGHTRDGDVRRVGEQENARRRSRKGCAWVFLVEFWLEFDLI